MSKLKEFDETVNRATDTLLLAIGVAVALASVDRLWVFMLLFLVFIFVNAGLKYIGRRMIAKENAAIDELMADLLKGRKKPEA